MKRKLLVLFLTICLILSSTFTVFANDVKPNTSSISVIVDENPIDSTDQNMYINNDGTKMYPLRFLSEGLGVKVSWDESKQSALILTSEREIWLNPSTEAVTVNGVSKKLNYNVELVNSRIYIPAEFISEIIGARFDFDEATKTITLENPAESLESTDLSDSEKEAKKAIASYLTSFELRRNFSGQVLVVNEGKILIDRSYGYSDYENHIKAFNDTTFGIGSATKQFTAAAIMQLAEKNELSFDDKVSTYLDNVPFGDEITIHHLLTHTSGLFNYTNLLPTWVEEGMDYSEMDFDKIMSIVEEMPLDFEIGTSWNYSNTGYLILGEIVEKISGKSLEEYLQENIFIPANMESTGIAYRLDEKIVEANGYSGDMEVVLDTVDEMLINVAYGAGNLSSTAQDLYRWNIALQAGEIISMESLERMFGKADDMNLIAPYAYAWMFNQGQYGEEIYHGGNLIGFTALNTLIPEKNAQVIILTNKGYVDLESIKNDVVSILDGNVVNPVEELQFVSEEQMNKYVGTYEITGMMKFEVLVENGKFILFPENQIPLELVALSQTRFKTSLAPIEIDFDSQDVPTKFTFYQAGMEFDAVKIK